MAYFYSKKALFFKHRVVFYIIPVIIVGELALFSNDFSNPKCAHNPFYEKGSLEFLKEKNKEQLYRIGRYKDISRYGDVINWMPQILPPNLNMSYEIYDMQGYDSLTIYDYMDFLSLINKDSRKIKKPYPLTLREHLDSKLLDFLNVKYLLSVDYINSDKYKLMYDEEIKIYENLKALPRFFIVQDVLSARDRKEVKSFISGDFFDPSITAVVEGDLPSFFDTGGTLSKPFPDVKIIKYAPNTIELKSGNIRESAFLVSSEVFYPGWKVYVDGSEKVIYKINLAFRGVFLDNGIHNIRFIYEPVSFKKGAIVSIAGILLILCITGYNVFYERRKKYKI